MITYLLDRVLGPIYGAAGEVKGRAPNVDQVGATGGLVGNVGVGGGGVGEVEVELVLGGV